MCKSCLDLVSPAVGYEDRLLSDLLSGSYMMLGWRVTLKLCGSTCLMQNELTNCFFHSSIDRLN